MPRCIHALERRQRAAFIVARREDQDEFERGYRVGLMKEARRAMADLHNSVGAARTTPERLIEFSPEPPPRPFLERILDRMTPWPK